MDLLTILIGSLYNIDNVLNIKLYPISMYNYNVSIKNKFKKRKILKYLLNVITMFQLLQYDAENTMVNKAVSSCKKLTAFLKKLPKIITFYTPTNQKIVLDQHSKCIQNLSTSVTILLQATTTLYMDHCNSLPTSLLLLLAHYSLFSTQQPKCILLFCYFKSCYFPAQNSPTASYHTKS